MANNLLKASLGLRKEDERDSYLNKRIDTPGALVNNLFRNYFNKLVKDMQKQIVREINNGSWRSSEDYTNIINMTNIYKIIKSTTIENGIKRALATGDFGIKHSNSNKVGVAQVLNRLTYISSLSHLRRVNTPIDKSGKLIPPRKLHNTSWGFICPPETPEGHGVGVVKNLSILTHVTIPSDTSSIYEYIAQSVIPVADVPSEELSGKVKVIVNGCWVGISINPYEFYASLKDKKYKGIINIYTSIVFNIPNMEIRVCNDAGRLCRPVLRVIDNQTLFNQETIDGLASNAIKWNDLLVDSDRGPSIIEYIDAEEQSLSLIAITPDVLSKKDDTYIYRYTHCEIHPSIIFGILASCIPFPEHIRSDSDKR